MTSKLIARAAALGVAACAFGAQAADYGVNLIVNGDAEQGVTGWTAFDGYPLFQSVPYGSNWVLPTQPGPADRGSRLFVGGASSINPANTSGWQSLDLTANAADVAAGRVSYDLSGWIGGWAGQEDNAMLYVTFLDGSGTLVGDASIGPVTNGDRGGITALLYREAGGIVPTATRSITFNLTMQRLSGGDNDGYADNLSFVLSAVPEPGTWGLMAAGLAGIAVRARRRA